MRHDALMGRKRLHNSRTIDRYLSIICILHCCPLWLIAYSWGWGAVELHLAALSGCSFDLSCPVDLFFRKAVLSFIWLPLVLRFFVVISYVVLVGFFREVTCSQFSLCWRLFYFYLFCVWLVGLFREVCLIADLFFFLHLCKLASAWYR